MKQKINKNWSNFNPKHPTWFDLRPNIPLTSHEKRWLSEILAHISHPELFYALYNTKNRLLEHIRYERDPVKLVWFQDLAVSWYFMVKTDARKQLAYEIIRILTN